MKDGIIVKAVAGFYYVKTEEGVLRCRARGIFKKEGLTPLVGDKARITPQDAEEGVLEGILPRRNAFVRPPIANVDAFACVISVRDPAPNPEILDRFLLTAEMGGSEAVILINKTDLGGSDEVCRRVTEIYGGLYTTLAVSARAGLGIDDIKRLASGKLLAFAGPSGVGKSSLINLLVPIADMEVGEVSGKTRRGKHTTRHVEILDNGEGLRVIDTPGYTSFDAAIPTDESPDRYYPDFAPLLGQCRFDNCRHLDEPGCAIKAAAAEGGVAPSRYENYRKLMAQAENFKQIGRIKP